MLTRKQLDRVKSVKPGSVKAALGMCVDFELVAIASALKKARRELAESSKAPLPLHSPRRPSPERGSSRRSPSESHHSPSPPASVRQVPAVVPPARGQSPAPHPHRQTPSLATSVALPLHLQPVTTSVRPAQGLGAAVASKPGSA